MRRFVLVLATAGLLVLPVSHAFAEDSVQLERNSALLGEHIEMRVQVTAAAGYTVELTPGTPGWAGVELVSVEEVTRVSQGDGVLWFIVARVAAFAPGNIEFAPTVSLTSGAESTSLSLPAAALSVRGTLGPEDPLELSPLAAPTEIPGAQSRLLVPAVVGGVIAGSAVVALLIWFAARLIARRLRRPVPVAAPGFVPPTLDGAEQLLHSDPVGAYRLMSSVVKGELARRYEVRATALTTTELRRRLESSGDRWEARLVGGLLEECDSVIYAGYRPAAERREHDLTMAREIVEAPA